jgi:general secretion pathway protein H
MPKRHRSDGPLRPTACGRQQHGLTLLELMVVLAIVALSTALVTLSLRDNPQTRLQREADRLIAQIEATRALARSNAQALGWQAVEGGYQLGARRQAWLSPDTQATLSVGTGEATPWLWLGPEPLIQPARIRLQQGNASLTLVTDGLRPFDIQR